MAISPPSGAHQDDEAPHDNDEQPEARDLKVKRALVAPSQAEIDKHNVSHYPPRDWCKYCNEGWMREMQHKLMKEQNDIPLIAFDYARTKPGIKPILVAKCGKRGNIMMNKVEKKGHSDDAIHFMKEFIFKLMMEKL